MLQEVANEVRHPHCDLTRKVYRDHMKEQRAERGEEREFNCSIEQHLITLHHGSYLRLNELKLMKSTGVREGHQSG